MTLKDKLQKYDIIIDKTIKGESENKKLMVIHVRHFGMRCLNKNMENIIYNNIEEKDFDNFEKIKNVKEEIENFWR